MSPRPARPDAWRLAFASGAAFALFGATPALAATREAEVGALMERLKTDPPALRVFLTEMPKGGDLHNHLDGSVWAEDLLDWAAEDGDCLDGSSHAISSGPCGKGQVEAKGLATRDPAFYQASLDALSVRNFVPRLGTGEVSGHDHTFAAFPRFGVVSTMNRHRSRRPPSRNPGDATASVG
jgi:adenosine deaminase